MRSSEHVDVIVLAGGHGQRFEAGEKALATVGDRSILARSVDMARQVTDRTPILAVETEVQRERYDETLTGAIRYVYDAPGEAGPVAGLRSAVEASDATWLFVLGCDMPLVEKSAITWLAAQRDETTDAVVPRTDDGIHPLHAWYRQTAVQTAIESGLAEHSLRALLDRLTVTVVSTADAPETARLERSLCNVNTGEDLAEARRLVEE